MDLSFHFPGTQTIAHWTALWILAQVQSEHLLLPNAPPDQCVLESSLAVPENLATVAVASYMSSKDLSAHLPFPVLHANTLTSNYLALGILNRQNVHTAKNLAFVVCRAKGRLRLAVLLGSGLVRSFGVLVFRMVAELLREHPSVAVLRLQSGASLSRDEHPSTENCR